MSQPYTIKIFMPTGEPNGLRILERPNWTGVGVAFNRNGFSEAIKRDELKKTGVYILVGDASEEGAFPTLYIGEGDPVLDRLKNHNANKDFWNVVIAFTAKDDSLNKAHVQYLESRLVEIARKMKQSKLENGTVPAVPSLAEAERADMEFFLGNILSIIPLLGLTAFDQPKVLSHSKDDELFLSRKNIKVKASAMQTSTGFVVLKHSEIVDKPVKSCPPGYIKRRADLFANGVFSTQDGKTLFTENVTFTSPSYASSIVLGRSSNGLIEWKNAKGQTLKEIQAHDSANE